MRLSKLKMFFALNGFIAFVVACYCTVWFTAPTAPALITTPFAPTKILVTYKVGGRIYDAGYLRNDIPFDTRYVTVRYLSFAPSYSRVNTFMGVAAEPLAWWLVFFLASSMLLLTNNLVFSKGTQFFIRRKFPWISMEEYFRVPWLHRWHEPESSPVNKQSPKRLER